MAVQDSYGLGRQSARDEARGLLRLLGRDGNTGAERLDLPEVDHGELDPVDQDGAAA